METHLAQNWRILCLLMGMSELPSGRDEALMTAGWGLALSFVLSQFLLGRGVALSTYAVLGAKYQCSRPCPALCRFRGPWRRCDGAA